MAFDILIVDDEADIRQLISGILCDEGYETRTAYDSDSTLKEIEARRPSLVILDIWLQGSRLDGLELLELIKCQHRELPVIMISGHGNIETAVAAIKRGAYDFIEKPFKMEQLLSLVARATEAERMRRENEELRSRAGIETELTGRSPAITAVRQIIEKVAPTGSRVLINGPPGSGKEVVARLLHNRSQRKNAAFIIVNAANMDPQHVEQALFGVEQNRTVVKFGLFEQAHGGTLFLDEVADMPLTTQAKILRVLTDQTFERVGGAKRVHVDVRVISASNRDLRAEISHSRFREDLFHRLNVVPIRMPALSDRREDIPSLTEYFIEKLAVATGRSTKDINQDALAALQAFAWPGNVRQLRNIIERILILDTDRNSHEITIDMLPREILDDGAADIFRSQQDTIVMATPLREARESFEREYLRLQITRFSGNISRTASFVGMERSALHRKLKSLGLNNGARTNGEDN